LKYPFSHPLTPNIPLIQKTTLLLFDKHKGIPPKNLNITKDNFISLQLRLSIFHHIVHSIDGNAM